MEGFTPSTSSTGRSARRAYRGARGGQNTARLKPGIDAMNALYESVEPGDRDLRSQLVAGL